MFHQWAIHMLELLGEYGFFGIAFALMIEVIPSEIVLSYGGYLVATNKISFIAALIAGVFGGTMAQLFLYWLGIYGGRPFFDRYGRYFFMQKKHLDAAEKWFDTHGTIVIFTARFIPVIRHAISIPAGIANMSFYQFTLYTIAAMIPWTILFLLVGMQLETHWEEIQTIAIQYLRPVIFIKLSILFIYFIYKYWHKRKVSKRR